MIARALLGALAGAATLMVWGFVYWALLPFGFYVMHATPHEADVVATLDAALPETGVYMVPMMSREEMSDEAAMEAFTARHERGPLLQIFYRADGVNPMGGSVYFHGFLNMFTSALIVAGLLVLAAPGLLGYGQRVLFVFLLGLFAGVTVELAKPIWWHQPWDFWVFQALFPISGWLVVGLVMAAIVKPPVRA